MSNEERPLADEPKPADVSAPAAADAKELADDDLQSVSGGLMSTGHAALPSNETAVCVSQL